MSDPMSSGEIEDVLSSIRRLVADDGPPPAPVIPVAGEPGKLILTPALRVVTDPEADAGAAGDEAPSAELPPGLPAAAESHDPEIPAGEVPSPAIVASIGAATDLGGTIWESETGDAWSAELNADEVTAIVRTAVLDPSLPPAEVPEAGPEQTTGAAFAPSLGVLAEEMAGTGPAVEDPAMVAQEPAPADGPFGIAEAEPVPEPAEVPVAASPTTPDALPPSGAALDLSFVRRAARTAPSAETPPVPGSVPELNFAEDFSPFDEEAIRDLIRDLIREELQGNMGERITRNVRKLVRAEVQRALAARAFD